MGIPSLFQHLFPLFAQTALSLHRPDSPVQPDRQTGAYALDNLHQNDNEHHRRQHHTVIVLIVPIVNGNLTQTAAADGACHSAIAENGDKRGGDRRMTFHTI